MHRSQQVSGYQLIYLNQLAKFDMQNVRNNISNIAHNVWNNISNIASSVTRSSVDTALTNVYHDKKDV